jgi:hypothetical protein
MEPAALRETDAPTAVNDRAPGAVARRWIARSFRWHAGAMVVANLLLSGVNVLTGGTWWAFWPLVISAALLAIHYFVCKAAAADDRWVEERVEELNLKSYDRSHIEGLKSRYGDDMRGGKDDMRGGKKGAP